MKKFKAVSLVIFLCMTMGCQNVEIETRILTTEEVVTEFTTEENSEKPKKLEVTTERITTEATTEATTEELTTEAEEITTQATTEVIFEPEVVEEDEPEEATDTDAEEVVVVDDETDQDSYIYMGNYELTAYCSGSVCADGAAPIPYYTAASNDPNLWHKWIHIEGYGDYYVHDTGGMSSNVIDLFLGDYDSCIAFGRQSGEVYIIQ